MKARKIAVTAIVLGVFILIAVYRAVRFIPGKSEESALHRHDGKIAVEDGVDSILDAPARVPVDDARKADIQAMCNFLRLKAGRSSCALRMSSFQNGFVILNRRRVFRGPRRSIGWSIQEDGGKMLMGNRKSGLFFATRQYAKGLSGLLMLAIRLSGSKNWRKSKMGRITFNEASLR